MKNAGKRHAIELAVSLAVMMHLLLFMAIRPASGDGLAGAPVPPETHYLAHQSGSVPAQGSDIRTVWSPVLFSLPSKMGFSRDLLQEKLHTRLTFRQPDETESFLDVNLASRDAGAEVIPQELMLTAGRRAAPRPPSSVYHVGTRPAPHRVYIAPELKERLVGGVVLPPELNQRGDAAWEVRADMSISKYGAIRHVFLEQPLEAAPLNQALIQLLHGLHFKSGEGPVDGRIEIYSSEAVRDEGASQ